MAETSESKIRKNRYAIVDNVKKVVESEIRTLKPEVI